MITNDIIYNALISFQFIANCCDPSNYRKQVREVKSELEFKSRGEIMNPAIFISQAYLLLVLAKEANVADFSPDPFKKFFKVKLWVKDKTDNELGDKAIIRRVRNALSHAKIDYSENTDCFTFKDGINDVVFEADIRINDLRSLLLDFLVPEWHKQNR